MTNNTEHEERWATIVREADEKVIQCEDAWFEAQDRVAVAIETAGDGMETRDVRTAKRELAQAESALDRAKKKYEIVLARPVTDGGPVNTPTTEMSEDSLMTKKVAFPKNMPTYRQEGKTDTYKDPLAFIEKLENVLFGEYVEEKHWSRALLAQVGRLPLAAWIKTELIEKRLDWEETKERFLKKCLTSEVVDEYNRELKKAKLRREEEVSEYVDRFRKLVENVGRDVNEYSIIDQFVDTLYTTLRNKVREKLCEMPDWKTDWVPLTEYVKLMCVHYSDRGEREPKFPKDGKKPEGGPEGDWIAKCRKEGLCSNCGQRGHRHFECKEAKMKRCFGCGAENTIRSECKKCNHGMKGKGSDRMGKRNLEKEVRRLFQMEVQKYVGPVELEEETEAEDSLSKTESEYFCLLLSLDVKDKKNMSVVIDMLVDGHEIRALADSGATSSFIRRSKAVEWGWKGSVGKGTIKLCGEGEGTEFPRIGTTKNVRAAYGPREIKLELEWFDLPENAEYDLVLGLPDWAGVGLAITGIQCPGKAEKDEEADADERRHYLGLGEEGDLYRVDRENWTKETADLWKDNSNIPYGNHCTFPGAVISLDVGDNAPVYVKQYRLPHHDMLVIDEWLKDMLKYSIVEPATPGCPWNNPLNVQDKKDPTGLKGTEFRTCLDARALNKLLINQEKGQIPYITDMHEHANGYEVHSSWDYWKCYHQFLLAPETRPMTAFTHRGKQYWFRMAPMGVTPFSFKIQHTIMNMIESIPTAKNYLDDVLSSDKSIEDHKQNCTEFLKLCNRYNLRLRFAKCHFFQTHILSVGRIISKERIAIDPRHRDMISNWPRPTTGSQVASLLGFAGFVRNHIPDYATITQPLEKLKKRKKKSIVETWTGKEETAFRDIVTRMSNAVTLFQPNWGKKFYLATDASTVGGGGMLYQKGLERRIRIIGFWSKAWNHAQSCYSSPEREFLAARQAMDYFRTYLFGKQFTLVTDCSAITFMLTKPEPSVMIQRYIIAMSEYSFDIQHLPGIRNVLPDVLSRRYALPQPATDSMPLRAITRSHNKRFVDNDLRCATVRKNQNGTI